MIDPISFCRTFYSSHNLPVAYYQEGEEVYIAGVPASLPTFKSIIRFLLHAAQYPALYMAPDMGLYGIVRLCEKEGAIVVGPAYSGAVTDKMVQAYMNVGAVPRGLQVDVAQFLSSIPQYSYNRFISLLVHLHLVLNGEELSLTEHFGIQDASAGQKIAALQASRSYEAREEQTHGTYNFEQRMLEYVRQGDPEQMRSFLLDTIEKRPLAEGVLADSPLRQAKNLFLGTVTMVGKVGAIPGGMDVEQTYQLIDAYIQECEKMQTLDAVKSLQYSMLMDFTSRVQQAQLPAELSAEIFICVQYINARLIDSLSVQDVADQIGRSRAYLSKKFKQETGKSVGQYIADCRIREAKTLLKYTDRSLAEISDYLHFSSQPYFQNVFKRLCGTTPARYRTMHSN